MLVAILVAAGLAAYAAVSYRGVAARRGRDRVVLVSLRLAALALLVFCLVRPTLVLRAAVPQQNFLGVLIDDSRSMKIADGEGQARSEFITHNFGRPDSPLLAALSKRFAVRLFRFSASADRLQSGSDLTFDGTRTRLGDALDRARDELAGLPLSGLVLVTDGADTSDAALDDSLSALKARSISVFPVGIGQEHLARDVQITRVETPRSALKGTALVVNVVVTASGYAGATVPLTVEDGGRIVSSQDVTLPSDGDSTTVPVRFMASDAGPRLFRFRVAPQPGEQITENNERAALIEISDRRERILYFEGEPRPEAKFIRYAVADDKNLQVVLLQRTAQDKYYRLGVDSADELAGAFPKSREELFAYRGIILGSVEAASFTPEQLRMLADFVNRRGGGLLMLGGRRSFGEGGYGGTPVADVLPVVLEAAQDKGADRLLPAVELSVRPTRAGAVHPIAQITAKEQDLEKRWRELPALTSVNSAQRVKPGATVLLSGLDDKGRDQVVLAFQRYGRGKALAFPVQDSWMWRMHAKMAPTDLTYMMFWRRLARWLVEGVPGPVVLTTSADEAEPGEPVQLSAQVTDSTYAEVNDGRVVARVTAPSGKATEFPMEWTVKHDGEYRGTFTPDEQGLYQVRVEASREKKELGADVVHLRATPSDAEYFDAGMRAPLLKRIAEQTGGRFFTADNVGGLPEAISYNGRGVTVVEARDLWDMPVLLLLIIGLVGGEWALRRARGLV